MLNAGLLGALAAVLLLLPGCKPGAERTPAEQNSKKIVNVTVAPVEVRDMEEPLAVSAILAPDLEVMSTAETAGVAERIQVKKGDRVRAGDLLAEIDRKNAKAALDRAQAALRQVKLAREEADLGVRQAEARLETARIGVQQARLALFGAEKVLEKAGIALANQRSQFERVEKLYQEKLASQAAFDDARAALKALEADHAAATTGVENSREAIGMAESALVSARLGVDSSRLRVQTAQAEIESQTAALAQAELHYQKGLLIAPFDGFVDDIFFDQGEFVKAESPIIKLIRTDPMKAEVSLAEKDIPFVRSGQRAEVSIGSLGASFSGLVTRVALSADIRTNTYPVEITLANPRGALKAGMVAEARLVRRKAAGVVSIPTFAVIPKEDGNVVFVLDKERAVRRKVTTGILENGRVEVVEGLHQGEQVIVKGQRDLRDGQEVKVQP